MNRQPWWVYDTDEPMSQGSSTDPRTEMRWRQEYTSGRNMLAHDASAGSVEVYFDDELVLTRADRGPATRHFKNGVYHHGSGRAEARFRNITYWTR